MAGAAGTACGRARAASRRAHRPRAPDGENLSSIVRPSRATTSQAWFSSRAIETSRTACGGTASGWTSIRAPDVLSSQIRQSQHSCGCPKKICPVLKAGLQASSMRFPAIAISYRTTISARTDELNTRSFRARIPYQTAHPASAPAILPPASIRRSGARREARPAVADARGSAAVINCPIPDRPSFNPSLTILNSLVGSESRTQGAGDP